MNNANRGYEFFFNRPKKVLKVRAWGMWDVEFTKQYDRDLRERIKKINAEGIMGWCVLVDLDDYPPQTEDVQAIIIDGMKFGIQHGLKKEARIIGKALTKMQLQRLVQEAGMPENSTFQTEEEAIAWLTSEE